MVPETLDNALERLKEPHLLVIGDVMVDRYFLGEIERISPEAPVPVFRQTFTQDYLGGAGNVARTIASLGAKISFVSVIGHDKEGDLIETFLGDLSPMTSHLLRDDSRCTSLKVRYIAQNQQIMRADRENVHPLSKELELALLSIVPTLAPHIHGVILSDYGKGVLTPSLTQSLIDVCHHHGLPTFVDPKEKCFSKYKGAQWLTPNRRELSIASGYPVLPDHNAVEKACLKLMGDHDLQGILATRSEQGMSLISPGNSHHLPAHILDVFDVSGAGDTVLATFALGIVAGLDPVLAATLSNHAASVVIGKSGTATLTLDDLRQHINKAHRPFKTKYLPCLNEAQKHLFHWRRHGLKIGLTNGCFDILHPGHVHLLKQAKERCDRLIVALNTDMSIKRFKGPERPIHDLQHRVQVLEGFEAVDLIVPFGEDTPLDLICLLQPDVLFKGADYSLDQVVGAKEMTKWGGHVELLDLVKGYSTTSTVNKLKQSA